MFHSALDFNGNMLQMVVEAEPKIRWISLRSFRRVW